MLRSLIKKNLYKDSVALMRVAEALQSLPGVMRATLMMATPANLDILEEAGLLPAGARDAKPSDLIIAVDATGEPEARTAIAAAETRLAGGGSASAGQNGSAHMAPRSMDMALAELPAARLAQISVPGPYAAAEALKAIKRGLDVFMFSDNVPIEQERLIKRHAERAGRLVMGPDCGTAIVGGVPLGFANAVRRGRIGAVAASGTGLQEITCQVHRLGEGISHALGTGGRDLHADIGGISMRQGLAQLAADPATEVIVIVSKPPAPEVASSVLAAAQAAAKPVVVLFLGASDVQPRANIHPAANLHEAAALAVALARRQHAPRSAAVSDAALAQAASLAARFKPGQRWLRGLYSGGTFCTEAQLLLQEQGIACWSNVPIDKKLALADPRKSREHTVVDLGADEFTVGRPHPMIDFGSRVERILAEAEDPKTAVILLDVVLGWGSHPDPAAALAPAVSEARTRARRRGADPLFIGFVCGTEEDAQGLTRQRQALAQLGMLLADSSAGAAQLAAAALQAAAI